MLETIESVTVIIGVIIAAVSLVVSAKHAVISAKQASINANQAVENSKIVRAQFWLELRKMFAEHNEAHFKLRPGGEWYEKKDLPSVKEFPKVEAYMGLFEHCKHMLDDNLIDWQTFKSIYGYRIGNILHNTVISDAKFKNPRTRKGWKDFIDLAEALGYDVPSPNVT